MRTVWGVNLSERSAKQLDLACAMTPDLTSAGWLDLATARPITS